MAIILTAGRLGVMLQPEDLSETAYRLYEAVHIGLAARCGSPPGSNI